MEEQWREVPSDPDYFASSAGRVRGKSGRVMSPYVGRHGYELLTVCHEKQYLRKVHRMVCEAFNGPAPEGSRSHARNLDGNRLNNRAENLAWGTPKDNSADALHHGTRVQGMQQPDAKLSDDDVREVRRLLAVEPLLTQRMIGDLYEVSDVVISNIKLGKTWGHVDA